jgi:hypothetical protein
MIMEMVMLTWIMEAVMIRIISFRYLVCIDEQKGSIYEIC